MDTLKKLRAFIWTREFLKKFGLVVLFYLLVITITIFYLSSYTNHGQQISVPNLVGKTVAKSTTILEELDLTYEVLDSIYDPSKPEGTIIDQDPDPTSFSKVFVKEGRIIRLRVSKKSRMI